MLREDTPPPHTRGDRRAVLTHAVAAVLIGILSWGLLSLTRSVDVQIDEPDWITAGDVTYTLVAERASIAEWSTAFDARGLGAWGNMNPPVGKLLIGLATATAKRPTDTIAYQWIWGQTAEWNASQGRLPPRHILLAARRGIAIIGVLCLGLVYLIAVELVGARAIAWWAPLSLFANPVFRAHSAMVYTNVPQLLFMLLSSWLCIRFLRHHRWRWLIGAMVAAGLACAVKYNAVPLVVAAALVVPWAVSGIKRRLMAVALILALPVAVFVVVNPYLYHDPLDRTLATLREWSRYTEVQQQEPLLVATVVPTVRRAASLIMTRAVVSQEHAPPYGQTTRGSLGLLEGVGAVFVASMLAMGIRARSPTSRWRVSAAWLSIAFSCAVAYWVFYDEWGGSGLMMLAVALVTIALPRTRAHLTQWFVVAAFVACTVATALWLPFDWARNFLLVAVWVPVLQVMGLAIVGAGDRTISPSAIARRLTSA